MCFYIHSIRLRMDSVPSCPLLLISNAWTFAHSKAEACWSAVHLMYTQVKSEFWLYLQLSYQSLSIYVRRRCMLLNRDRYFFLQLFYTTSKLKVKKQNMNITNFLVKEISRTLKQWQSFSIFVAICLWGSSGCYLEVTPYLNNIAIKSSSSTLIEHYYERERRAASPQISNEVTARKLRSFGAVYT